MKKRIVFLDLWRGLAVIAMVIFHIFFMVNFYDFYVVDMGAGVLKWLGDFARWSFLILVGISFSFSSRNQLVRGGKLFLIAMLITLVTYFAVGEEYVRFGIFHLIAVAIILGSGFRKKPLLAMILGVLIFGTSFWIRSVGVSNWWMFLLGNGGINSIDYFPIFPWLGVVFFGIGLGKVKWPAVGNIPWIEYLGKHSLVIYLIHVPVIWLVMMIV